MPAVDKAPKSKEGGSVTPPKRSPRLTPVAIQAPAPSPSSAEGSEQAPVTIDLRKGRN